MTFVPQTFSSNAVLAASDLNTMDGNIDEVRSNHKGPSAPASITAGTDWIEDDNPSSTVWSRYTYDGTDQIKWMELDSTNNRARIFCGHGNFTEQVSAAAITAATLLTTGVSTFGAAVTLNSFIANYRVSDTLAQSASVVIVPDSELSTVSQWELFVQANVSNNTQVVAAGNYRGAGAPAVTQLNSDSNIAVGYTASSGFWARNLNAGSIAFRVSGTRKY